MPDAIIGIVEGFAVRIEHGDGGWSVHILGPDERILSSRACGDEVEARTYASAVRQHIEWLSPEAFRRYYRLEA